MSIEQGFDRGIDFKEIKETLIKTYQESLTTYYALDETDRYYYSKKRKIVNRIIYLLVAMIQLINGSRISEACDALRKILDSGDYTKKVITKIAKSESIKYKADGKKYVTKARYRNLLFPNAWITISEDMKIDINYHLENIEEDVLRKRVLDYLLKHHKCNTHSLRYACINHLLYVRKMEASLVAKHVGHSSMAQLVRYTQKKEADKLFDLDL
jgi:integrase